jgi:hypothetical protein
MFPDSRMRFPPVRLLLGLVLGAGILHARPPEEFPGLGEKWRYYTSPHFEMYSAADDFSSRDALQRLELLRAIVLDNFKLKERLPLPVTIFYFDSTRDFLGYLPDEYKKNQSYVGFCVNQADRTVITLSPSENDDAARTVIYHEYIHYVFRITEQNPAPWFNEGVAELYSTIKDGPLGVEVGLPSVGRTMDLRHSSMLPLEQLFGATYGSEIFTHDGHTGVFYAESWAFLHFCLFGTSKFSPEKLHEFLDLASDPATQAHPEVVRQACRDLLGCDYPELIRQVERYIVDGSYHWRRFTRPKIDPPKSYAQRPVTREEMTDRLAELSLRINRTPSAKLELLHAVDREPGSARLQEVLGNDALRDGEMTGVREHWEKAVALDTPNPAIYHQLGRIEGERWFSRFDYYFRMPPERADRLRKLLHRSIERAPEQSDAYETLAWVEATSAEPYVANVNLVQSRFPTLNHKARTLLALSLVRVHLGDTPAAAALLDQIGHLRPDAAVTRAAAIIRAKIDEREVGPQEAAEVVPDPIPAHDLVLPIPHR